VKWGIDLQSEHERYLTEKHAKKPVIVMNYPKDIKAFYMRVNDDGRTVAAMDVLAPGIGEIIGGSQREERLDVLDARMAERAIDKEHYAWYRDLRRYGTVPHAGFGLGFERTLAYLTASPMCATQSRSRARPAARDIDATAARQRLSKLISSWSSGSALRTARGGATGVMASGVPSASALSNACVPAPPPVTVNASMA
jgi:hypothetical protein